MLQIIVGLALAAGLPTYAAAQDYAAEGGALGFKFQANTPLLDLHFPSQEADSDVRPNYRQQAVENKPSTYDAILFYPLHRKGVSIDLGVNLRMPEEASTQPGQPRDWLSLDPSEAQPLLHAAALFELPFSGFQAGVSGTYNTDPAISEYDYRAKLSYKWRNGLGMEGGWQHQQRLDELQNVGNVLDSQSLFLDMKVRF